MRSTLLALSLGLLLTSTTSAGECDNCIQKCHSCGEKVCCTYAKPGEETKHCWEVECKEVCIPAVRFPWECWGAKDKTQCVDDGFCLSRWLPIKCGKVKTVRVLKKVEYKCPKCEYEHRIECRVPCADCLPE